MRNPPMQRSKPALIVVALAGLLGCTSTPTPPEDLTWASWGLGSAVETRTVTRLERVRVRDSVSTSRHTLKSKTETEASIALEVDGPGGATTASTMTVPLNAPKPVPEECPGMTVQTSQETVAVAAGTFEC